MSTLSNTNAFLQQDDRDLFAKYLSSLDTSHWLDSLDIRSHVRIDEYLKQQYSKNFEPRITPEQPLQTALKRLTNAEKREIVSPDFPDVIDLAKFYEWATVYQQAFSTFDMFTQSDLTAEQLEYLRSYLSGKLERLVRRANQPQILDSHNVVAWTEDMDLKALINIFYHLASLLPSVSTRVFTETVDWPRLSRLRDLLEPDTEPKTEHVSINILKEAFHSPYLDPAGQVVRILNSINKYACEWSYGKERNLGPFTSLVQRSMFGKSRLLREMSHHVPVIYMNLRAEKPTNSSGFSSGFPQGHTNLGNWFDTINPSEYSRSEIKRLLGHAIVLFSRRLQELSPANGFSDMFDYLAEDPTFWNQVVTQTGQSLTWQDFITALAKVTSHTKGNQFPGLVILAVDEASRLLPSEKGRSVDRFRILREVIAQMFQGESVFLLVTDTNSKVAYIASPPSNVMSRTARGIDNDDKGFYPPVYLLNTMHIHARTFPICFDSWRILEFSRLIAFGRPAFHNLYTHMEMSDLDPFPEERIIEIAAAKLIMQKDVTAERLNRLFYHTKSEIKSLC